MKMRFLCLSMLIGLITLAACSSGAVMTQATGFAYEVVVVMDQDQWKGEAGEAIKGDLTASIAGLPQSEPTLRYVRNILVVTIDPAVYTKTSLAYEADRWAQNQVVVTLRSPDAASILAYLEEGHTLSDFFVKVEMRRAIGQLKDSYSTLVMDKLKGQFGVALNAPSNFTYYKDTTDFFWSSNNANTGRMDLVVYSFPYTDPNTFTADYLVAQRDSVMKANLPGSFPGSYVQTEKRAGVDYEAITLRGKYCGVMRGLWRVQGDMMGGPFVSLTRLDEQHNRVIVAEGFVYAPETEKRNFIRRIEASLYTLRLPDELEQPMEDALSLEQ